MRTFIALTMWSLSLVGVCAADPEGTDQGPEVISKVVKKNDVVLSVSLPTKCIAGESILLALSLRNEGVPDVSIFLSGIPQRDFRILIWDKDGKLVPPTEFGRKPIAGAPLRTIPRTLASGKGLDCSVNLSRLFDLTRSGTYSLTVHRAVNEEVPGVNGTPLMVEKFGFTVSEPPR